MCHANLTYCNDTFKLLVYTSQHTKMSQFSTKKSVLMLKTYKNRITVVRFLYVYFMFLMSYVSLNINLFYLITICLFPSVLIFLKCSGLYLSLESPYPKTLFQNKFYIYRLKCRFHHHLLIIQ